MKPSLVTKFSLICIQDQTCRTHLSEPEFSSNVLCIFNPLSLHFLSQVFLISTLGSSKCYEHSRKSRTKFHCVNVNYSFVILDIEDEFVSLLLWEEAWVDV